MIPLAAPALPLHSAGKYVAGAYIVFVVVLVVYLGIMSLRTARTQRELAELRRELAQRGAQEPLSGPVAAGRSMPPGRQAEPQRPEHQAEIEREAVQ